MDGLTAFGVTAFCTVLLVIGMAVSSVTIADAIDRNTAAIARAANQEPSHE
jgi:hypothetical protein